MSGIISLLMDELRYLIVLDGFVLVVGCIAILGVLGLFKLIMHL